MSRYLSTLRTAVPPKYTLASFRTFPSLEPTTFIPLPAHFLDAPLRRDFLWSAAVFEADRARVGSGNVPTKGDKPFSNRKLFPQKGSGRARTGDANSPIKDNGLKAHGIKAGHDWSTKLPNKIYAKAFQTAFSEHYRSGRLLVVDSAEMQYPYQEATKQFVKKHGLERLNLLFITNEQRDNLLASTEWAGKKADVLIKEAVEVRDLLKANRVIIELDALRWMIGKYSL